MRKVMISVAPVCPAQSRIDPGAIAADVYECYKLGASMVHLHVRDRRGKLTSDMSLLKETVDKIREKCNIVIEISTGGVSNLSIEERCQPCFPDYVEANSLNVGSVNLGEAVYQNPIKDVKYCVEQIMRNGKRPEIEVFELGMINTVRELDEEFHFIRPILFALVFGHKGEMPATLPALKHMVSYLYDCFPDRDEVLWGYTQANRRDWEMMGRALEMGASSIRIGFEDSDYLYPGMQVKTNAELIKKAAELVREKDCEPMNPDEVRRMMSIPVKQRYC